MSTYSYEPEYEEYLDKAIDEIQAEDNPVTQKIGLLGLDWAKDTLIPPACTSPIVNAAFEAIGEFGQEVDFKALAAIFAAAIHMGYTLGRKNGLAYLYFTQPDPDKETI